MRRLKLAGLLLLSVVSASAANSQGCSQCRESVGQTPVKTQAAYRKAIVVLVVAAGGVLSGAAIAFRRFR